MFNEEQAQRGIVKWFSDARGFGFINIEGVDEDIFAHFSSIAMDGFRTLRPGMEVEFRLVKMDRGFHAQEITPLSPLPAPASRILAQAA